MKYLITSLFCLFAFSNAIASIYIVETSKANLGECTGTITINATGEAGPFTFDIVALNDTEGTVPSVNNVSGVFTIKGLCPGSYSITHTDKFGCSFTINGTIEIEECEEIELVETPQIGNSISCDASGSISWRLDPQDAASGGTPPYTYIWSNGTVGLPQMNNLAPGIYTVTVTDSEGCTGTQDFEIEGEGIPDIYAEHTDACEEQNNGELGVSLSGNPSGEWSYQWSNGYQSPNGPFSIIENIGAGIYTVTISDTGNGCSAVYSHEVGEIPSQGELTIDTDLFTEFICYDSEDGIILLKVEGGNPPYTPMWDQGENSTYLHQFRIEAGTYTVTITDDCGREATRSFVIDSYPEIFANHEVVGGCQDEGQVNIIPTGGMPPYSYLWEDGSNSSTHNALGNGMHQVTIYDANDCELIENIEVSNFSASVVNVVEACGRLQDGAISILISNPENFNTSIVYKDLEYTSSSDSEIFFVLENLSSAWHTINISTENGCDIEIEQWVRPDDAVREFVDYDKGLCIYQESCKGESFDELIKTPPYIDFENVNGGKCEACVYCDDLINGDVKQGEIDFKKKRMRVGEYKKLLERAEGLYPFGYLQSLKDRLEGKNLDDCNYVRVCLANLEIRFTSDVFNSYQHTVDLGGGCERVVCEFPVADFVTCGDDTDYVPDYLQGTTTTNCRRIEIDVIQLLAWHDELKQNFPWKYKSQSEYNGLYDFAEEVIADPIKMREARCASVVFCEQDFRIISENLGEVECGEEPNYNDPRCLRYFDEFGNPLRACDKFPESYNLPVDAYYCKTDESCHIAFVEPNWNSSWSFNGDNSDVLLRFYQSDDNKNTVGKMFPVIGNGMILPKMIISSNKTNKIYDFLYRPAFIDEEERNYLVDRYSNFDSDEDLFLYQLSGDDFNLIYDDNNGIIWNKRFSSDDNVDILDIIKVEDEIIIHGTANSNLTVGDSNFSIDGHGIFIATLGNDGQVVKFDLIENIDPNTKVNTSISAVGDIVVAAKYSQGHLIINGAKNQMNFTDGLFVLNYNNSSKQIKIQNDLNVNIGVDILDITLSETEQRYALILGECNSIYNLSGGYSYSNLEPKALVLNFENEFLIWDEVLISENLSLENLSILYLDQNKIALGLSYEESLLAFGKQLNSNGEKDIALFILDEEKNVLSSSLYGSSMDEQISDLMFDPISQFLFFSGEFSGNVPSRQIGKYNYQPIGEVLGNQSYLSFINIADEAISARIENSNDDLDNLLSVERSSFEDKIKLYPNPTKNLLTIQQIDKELNSLFVEILSISGTHVDKIKLDSNKVVYDMSKLTKGVYIFRFKLRDRIVNKKVVKL